jgi:hypothetical protein
MIDQKWRSEILPLALAVLMLLIVFGFAYFSC